MSIFGMLTDTSRSRCSQRLRKLRSADAISSQPDRRAEIRRINSKRVIRRLLDRRDAWIGQMTGVAEIALIDGGAAAEFRVEPGSRMGVVSLERCRERGFFDTDAIGERIDARRLDQFAILHI